jgi:hypothetical protein
MMAARSGYLCDAVETGVNTEYNATEQDRLTLWLHMDGARTAEFIHNHPLIAGMTGRLVQVEPAV